LELVLIPAGVFKMGTEEPSPVYCEDDLRGQMMTGQIWLATGLAVLGGAHK
jgi:hypothetical protein